MTPYYADDWMTVYEGDCREVLATMPPASVHCVVTSPPFWGLRDYGVGGQLGLEPTPEEYVANMVAVFREVRRVLRDDGTVWLNLGDSYISGQGGRQSAAGACRATIRQDRPTPKKRPELENAPSGWAERAVTPRTYPAANNAYGWKPKDLAGIPWRVAFALQVDGWYLRSDIVWSKLNPMPESVTDRPTKAHEYVFLLTKSPRYFYDADAVREPSEPWQARHPDSWATGLAGGHDVVRWSQRDPGAETAGTGETRSGRNLRSVWTIATEPYPGAHFATFPRKLVEPCVKAGTSEKGVCPECGAPWVRVVERQPFELGRERERNAGGRTDGFSRPPGGAVEWAQRVEAKTTGWRPSCAHGATPVPATVLDPFAGSGTTLLVAQSLGRRAIGIDLNPEYLEQALKRNAQPPLGLDVA